MSILNIHMFGKFAIEADDQSFDCFRSQKAQELFCFLLIYRDQPHHREKLADLFCGERCISESKKYFRKTLWQLQSALNRLPLHQPVDLLSVDADWLQYNQNPDVCLDVLDFEEICASLQGRRGRQLDRQAFDCGQAAAALYAGDLLEGFCQDWCIFERERLKEMYFMLVDKLMGYCEARREYETGISYGRRILAMDCARESTHLRLMRLYSLAGNRTAAIRQFRTCRRMLKQEFDIEPAETTLEVYRRIVRFDSACPAIFNDSSKGEDASTLTGCMEELEDIKALVAMQEALQRQLLMKIHDLEGFLSHN